MLHIPSRYNIPAAELEAVSSYVAGKLSETQRLLAELDKSQLRIPYILDLLSRCCRDKEVSSADSLVVAGASHCLPCAWTAVEVSGKQLQVVPAYYMDLAVSSFSLYTETASFLETLSEKYRKEQIVITCGALDFYPEGKLHQSGVILLFRYFQRFVAEVSTYIPNAWILPIITPTALPRLAEVNVILEECCAEAKLRLLKLSEEITPMDERHFQPNYLQSFLKEI